jgi:putative glutathione S-transferase
MTGSKDNAVEENQSAAGARRAKGEFVRGVSGFRGSLGSNDFPAVPDQYHLYVALNCPWCHRVTLARNILGLQQSISMDVVFPNRTREHDPEGPNNWQFSPERIATVTGAPLPECTAETATGQAVRLVRNIYDAEGSTERSVPILYDRVSHRIVSNESAEIIRMLNRSAGPLGSQFSDKARHNLYPEGNNLRADINALNESI